MVDSNNDRLAFTGRVLMSLIEDMKILTEQAERVRVQVNALAKEYEISEAV